VSRFSLINHLSSAETCADDTQLYVYILLRSCWMGHSKASSWGIITLTALLGDSEGLNGNHVMLWQLHNFYDQLHCF